MLAAYVTHHARAARPGSDGASLRAHWEAAAAKGNRDAIRCLAGPDFPDALAYLYGWFHELNAARPDGMHGVAPLTFEQIHAWARLTDRSPEPYEVQALIEIDTAFRAAYRDEAASAPIADAPRPVEAWPAKKPAPTNGGHHA